MLATTLAVHGNGCPHLASAVVRRRCVCGPVTDAVGFVIDTIEKRGLAPPHSDARQELILDGLAILHQLADRFELHRPGYPRPGRFDGYANQFFARRLIEAHHRHNEHHIPIRGADGSRRWGYHKPPVSYDAIVDERARDGHDQDTYGLEPGHGNVRHINHALPLASLALAPTGRP